MPRGLNNKTMQQSNRSLILSLIIENPGVSRLDLARMTGLQKPTITNIVNELLELGIIENCEPLKSGEGNRKKGLVFQADHLAVLSVRITRWLYAAHLYDMNGEILDSISIPIDVKDEVERTLDASIRVTDELIGRNASSRILGMCLGLPGPYIRGEQERIIVEGFEQLSRVDISRYFSEKYDFPVIAEHDGHLSAFSEWKQLDRDQRSKVHCLLALQSMGGNSGIGIGIGAGIILEGKILEGAFGLAGEIGNAGIYFNGPKNSNGERGTLEYYASAGAAGQYIRMRLAEFPHTVLREDSCYEELLEAYEANDPLAVWVFEVIAQRLAYGLVTVTFVINPDKIIIGPDYPATERFIARVRSHMEDMLNIEISRRIDIDYSRIHTDPTLLGGYYYILERFSAERILLDRIKEAMGLGVE